MVDHGICEGATLLVGLCKGRFSNSWAVSRENTSTKGQRRKSELALNGCPSQLNDSFLHEDSGTHRVSLAYARSELASYDIAKPATIVLLLMQSCVYSLAMSFSLALRHS